MLLPLVTVDGARDFNYDAQLPDWERFWSLSARVRTLCHDDNGRSDSPDSPRDLKGRIAPGVIPYLLLHQPWTGGRQFLLPNLESLEWTVHWGQSLLQLPYLTSPKLRELGISIGAASLSSDPAIRCLKLLASLPGLKLRRLRLITVYKTPDQDLELAPAVKSLVQSQPNLSTLEFGRLFSQGEIIQSLHDHRGLVFLELLLPFPSYAPVQSSMQLLAERCPLIETLKLYCPETIPQPMTCDVIRPLFQCSRLRELQICYGGDFQVNSDSVRNMGQAWRDLETLNLCAGANNSRWDGAPFTLLLDFAREFSPKLRRLALNFTCPQELPMADVVPASFSQLEILGVGKSRIDPTDGGKALAEFLTSVCSEETRIAYILRDFWRADAFQTTGWQTAPETKSWVTVWGLMQSWRRILKVTRDRGQVAAGPMQW
ncbi:hypothetical protein FRC05_000281 [Tulasnella sp. 425]|nr:hypothetical protein FRC05_000281 [Tulasnella sp. 425]